MKTTDNNSENALAKDVKQNASFAPKAKTAEEVKKEAEAQAAKEKADAEAKSNVKKTGKITKVRIIGATAWLGSSWKIGQEKELNAKQAQELIDRGVAEKL